MSVVDDVKSRIDIVDIVSEYVNLQKAGRNFKALCPFHQEKTPSFVVFPDTQTWRCFGACGEGGDVFSFVMKSEGWDFAEALREMAKRAGVELEAQSPQQTQRQEELDRLRGLLEEAATFFHDQLRHAPEAQIARDYIAERGLTEDTAEAFTLGYAPDDWRQALHHLQMLGYSQDDVVEAGVAIRNDKGNVYDRFRHRLVIPIRDNRGRTVGFGARAFAKDAIPKYLNSPQGPLFDKSRLLYGLDLARRAIRETETAVIVEGYMDVMQAHQAGFTNVVAQMGTALTEDHLRQLDRYAERLILALDADAAGIKATMRGLNLARETLDGDQVVTFDPRGMMRYTGMLNMDIRIVSLPEGLDPDDLIRETPQEWETLIASAIPVADYVIQQATADLNDQSSPFEREQVARALLPILTATENDLQRNSNIQALARRVRIDERTLLAWTQRRQAVKTRGMPKPRERRKLADRPQHTVATTSGSPEQTAARERFCLQMLFEEPEWLFDANRQLRELQGGDPALADVLAPLHTADFSRIEYQTIFRTLEHALLEGDSDPADYLYAHLPPELAAVVEELRESGLKTIEHTLSQKLKTEFNSIVREQQRVNSLPQIGVEIFIQEALALRQSLLRRRFQELYFIQQDAQTQHDSHEANVDYTMQIEITRRALRLIAKTLSEMRGLGTRA